jgi:SAM-dependent methyltransferase
MTEHVTTNRASWDADAPNWVDRGRDAWASTEPFWGRGNLESEVSILPDVDGLHVVELGCGTGYVSAWLMRRGAHPIGLDNSSAQLATAAMLQQEFGMHFPLVHADAEHTPLRDGSFDFAISQYGAATWCDPYLWIPEAARILRPGGRLLFECGGPLVQLCFPTDDVEAPADACLHRDYFGMHRFEWKNAAGVVEDIEFRIGHGDMVRLLRRTGFEIEDLVELQPPLDADPRAQPYVPLEWARRWPSAEIWRVKKSG